MDNPRVTHGNKPAEISLQVTGCEEEIAIEEVCTILMWRVTLHIGRMLIG
jgi:hypothetical protein